ncbi:MAG: sigma-70 family RNA polymerase sigma factor [Verrucomicrobiota bacterium]|nr:sigma-70 family RNA polymerase sigma factor [Verrucomicrobiota bacterium]
MKNENKIPESHWMRTLVDAHATNLSRYVTSILHDQDAAKDVVQDAFMRLWKEPRKNVKGHERPWLFRVCRNRALDYQRKGSRLQAMNSATEQTPVDTPNPQTQAEEQDNHTQLLKLVRTLPDNQQEVIRLKFQNGMSYKEIADVTALSVSNVGFLLHTAINTLRTRILALGD